MTRQQALATQLAKVLDYFREEFDLTYTDAVGVLEMLKLEIAAEARDLAREEDEEDKAH
jgi:hypothetical protein